MFIFGTLIAKQVLITDLHRLLIWFQAKRIQRHIAWDSKLKKFLFKNFKIECMKKILNVIFLFHLSVIPNKGFKTEERNQQITHME